MVRATAVPRDFAEAWGWEPVMPATRGRTPLEPGLAPVERLKGIEPSSSDWKSEALPLSYSRVSLVPHCSSGALTRAFAPLLRGPRSQVDAGDHKGSSTTKPIGVPHRFR